MKETVEGFARVPHSPRLRMLVRSTRPDVSGLSHVSSGAGRCARFRRAERHPRCCSERGETIGDAQFIDGGVAGGTVTALERVDLFVIRSEKLADALAGHPEAGYELYRAIARSLAGRLRRAVGMLAFATERKDRS